MSFINKFKTQIAKKGIGGLDKIVMSLVVIGFLLVIGLALMGKVRDTQITSGCNSTGDAAGCSYAYNSSGDVIDAIDDIPTWLPIIVLAFIAVIVLGIVYMIKGRG